MKTFERYKGKALGVLLLKALSVGLGVGFLVGGVLLFLIKHEVLTLAPIFSLLFGFLSACIFFFIVFFLLKGNDKKLAKRLDKQFHLKEKVQTMLAHKNSEGAIYELQRQDASDSLKNAKGKRLDLKWLWAYILGAVLGVAVFVSALIVPPPVKPEPEPEPEVPFKLTELQEAALNELVLNIESSQMQEPYRTNVKTAVADLITGLKLSTTISQRNICIKGALDTIFEECDNSSLALELISDIWSSNTDATRALAKALNYYDWPLYDEWDKFVDTITDFRSVFIFVKADDGETTEEEKVEFVKSLLSSTATKILSSLESSGLSQDDELYTILVRLASANEVDDSLGTKILGLSALADCADELGYLEIQKSLDDSMLVFNGVIYKALSQHKANTDTAENAMTRICELFDYSLPQFERPRLIYASVGEDDSDNQEGGGGGAIGGGPTFGSDDLVYDPNTGEYVEYGEILNRYYAIMYGKAEAGIYTEEEKLALEKYFAILQDGFPEENEEEIEGEETNE